MENKKITWGDIHWFIGYKKNHSTVSVEVIPYVYNEDYINVKVLTNNKIYEGETRVGAEDIFEKYFNLTYYATFDQVLKEEKSHEKATYKKVIKFKEKLEKRFQKEIEKFLIKQQEQSIKEALEESTLDF